MDSEDDAISMPTVEKRSRTQLEPCIICSKHTPITELTSPRDENSWKTLLRAAEIQEFSPITDFSQHEEGTVPPIYYHRSCRCTFTHKKTLASSQTKDKNLSSEGSSHMKRKSVRNSAASTSRVYEEVCFFCHRSSKYIKSTNCRDTLRQCKELRSDVTIRNSALRKIDKRIMALLSREIVAAEAHYHISCYREYTRPSKTTSTSTPADVDPYIAAEHEAYTMLFSYVRRDLLRSPRVIRMTNLTYNLTQNLQSLGFDDIKDHTKKHIRRRLESEFGYSLCIINDNGKLLVMPDNLTREELAKQNIALTEKLNILEGDEKSVEKLLVKAALHLRNEVKGSVIKQPWPPLPAELDQEYMPLPDGLIKFYQVLLSGSSKEPSARTQRLTHSFAQDCVYCISLGQQKSSKHILTPWAIKTLTGNSELIKGFNRLGHGISYSQLAEIDTALAFQKLTVEDELGFAIPSNMYQQQLHMTTLTD